MSFPKAGISTFVGWGDTLHLPSNWNIKYKYFLPKREDCCVFLIKKIYGKFASTKLTCNLKKIYLKINITQFGLLKTK